MKVLLVQPPIRDFYDTVIRHQPIGLAYLKAALARHLPRVSTKIFDAHHGWPRTTIPLPDELSYLKTYYPYPDKSPFCLFHAFYHYGASFQEIADIARAEAPSVVGISCAFTPYYREVLETAAAIKAATGTLIVMGGAHVSADPINVLTHPAVDFVICGEGERPFVELVSHLEKGGSAEDVDFLNGVFSLGYKHHNRCVINPPPAAPPQSWPPYPDLSDFRPETYTYKGRPMAVIHSSRGCPHDCGFCGIKASFGRGWRPRGAADIVNEMRARADAGYRVFDFEDDNLTYPKKRFLDLCRLITQHFGPESAIELLALNGVCWWHLDEDILDAMKSAGFRTLNLSLVSARADVLRAYNRPTDVAAFERITHAAHERGFEITAYHILGLPGDTLDGMTDTLALLARLPARIGPSVCYVPPQTEIARRLGFPTRPSDYVRSRSTAMMVETPEFKRDDIYSLLISARIINFVKSLSPLAVLERLSLGDLLSDESRWTSMPVRAQSGLRILKILRDTGTLHADTPQGLQPLQHFNAELFARIQW